MHIHQIIYKSIEKFSWQSGHKAKIHSYSQQVEHATLVQTKEGMSEICWMDNWRAVLRSLTKKRETSWWHHQWCSLFRFTEGRLGGDQGLTWRRLGIELEKIKSQIKQIEQRAKCLQSSTHCLCALSPPKKSFV